MLKRVLNTFKCNEKRKKQNKREKCETEQGYKTNDKKRKPTDKKNEEENEKPAGQGEGKMEYVRLRDNGREIQWHDTLSMQIQEQQRKWEEDQKNGMRYDLDENDTQYTEHTQHAELEQHEEHEQNHQTMQRCDNTTLYSNNLDGHYEPDISTISSNMYDANTQHNRRNDNDGQTDSITEI